MSADHENRKTQATSRREFVRRAGKAILAITVVDVVAGYPRDALAAGCFENPPDANCGETENDGHCGLAGDADQACGTISLDANCGNSTASGTTAGPDGTDQDEACAANCADNNCGIAQLPNSGVDTDVDESCALPAGSGDQSCGDCDDNHETDEHCNVNGDTDELCGHQHGDFIINGGITTDDCCSATVPDAGCGTHTTEYGNTDADIDQHCGDPNPDMDCSKHPSGADANCNATSNPSTTSPDEHCGVNDPDDACSHYDADESCVSGPKDDACGMTTIEGLPDPKDNDDHCGVAGDPDNSDDPNEGPIAPYCPLQTDADYWDP